MYVSVYSIFRVYVGCIGWLKGGRLKRNMYMIVKSDLHLPRVMYMISIGTPYFVRTISPLARRTR